MRSDNQGTRLSQSWHLDPKIQMKIPIGGYENDGRVTDAKCCSLLTFVQRRIKVIRITARFLLVVLCVYCVSFVLAADVMTSGPAVNLKSLLEEMTDPDSVARWPEPAFTCKQSSSYDRAKVAPDKPGWFANNDNTQYIRKEEADGRQESVMMEADGPGAIVRFWLTA